ncbi:MAG: YbaK/EbsC family protein, partial [Micromonosporaceae bacterium]
KRASREFVLEATGQPVGGVAPIGHPEPIRTVLDLWLKRYDVVWAGGGTTHAMFPTDFEELLRLTGGVPAEVGD